MSATVRKIAVIRLILLMLFIILIFFLILAFLDFASLRNHFWPSLSTERKPARGYDQVWEFFQNQRKQKAGKTLFGSIRVKAVFVLFACSRKPSELPSVTRIASASPTFGCAQQWRVDWMTVEAAVSAALGKLQAARLPLQRCFGARETTYTRREDFKLSSSSIFLQRCLRRPGERFDAADACLCFFSPSPSGNVRPPGAPEQTNTTRRYCVVKVLSLPYLVPTLLVATIRK
jgi:hypothetical protein